MKLSALVKVLMLMLMAVALVSCASMREAAIDVTQEELQNLETARQVAITELELWPFQSGAIRGGLGDSISELPFQAVRAMDELDVLSGVSDDKELLAEHCKYCLTKDDLGEKKTPKGDFTLGYSLFLRVRLLKEIVKEALKQYAPDVLDLVKLL